FVAKKKKQQWAWLPSSQGSRPGGVDEAVKVQAEARARELIEQVLKPQHVKPPPEDARSNYITDITLKWHGSSLFFLAISACPGPNAIAPSFEEKFARMRYAGGDRFDLAYMRHTGQWFELHQGLTVDQCLEAIRDDPWFTP